MVPFTGSGTDVEVLTWGQRHIWRMMVEDGRTEMVGGTMPLDPGTTVDNIVCLLGFIMSRHESLRTRLVVRPDGTPMQSLAESGEIGLEIVDLAPDDDPEIIAEAIRERYVEAPYDYEKDWPVRMAVLCRGEAAVHFVAMYAHLVIDGYGFEALVRDLANLDYATGAHLGPRLGVQPIELARQQQSPIGRRQAQSSIRFWEDILRTIPPHRFHDAAEPAEPRYQAATYDSPAAYLALRILTQRTQLHSGPLLLTAYAIALSRVTGFPLNVIRMLVSNRFRPGFAESVATVAQPGLCLVDVADCTFDEAANRAWRGQLTAGKHAYYDPHEIWALQDRICAERGVDVSLSCMFNDGRRGLAQLSSAPPPTAAQLREALTRATLVPGSPVIIPEQEAYLTVNMKPDTINYSLLVDTHHLSLAEQETILRTVEEVLVTAALDPAAGTGVSASSTAVGAAATG